LAAEAELKQTLKRKDTLTITLSELNNQMFRKRGVIDTLKKDILIARQEKESICKTVQEKIDEMDEQMYVRAAVILTFSLTMQSNIQDMKKELDTAMTAWSQKDYVQEVQKLENELSHFMNEDQAQPNDQKVIELESQLKVLQQKKEDDAKKKADLEYQVQEMNQQNEKISNQVITITLYD
jgi:uncharacterized protein YhaN